MPRGKISARGGVGWASRIPLSSAIWDMRRLAKRGVTPLGREVMKRHSGTIRAAFRMDNVERKGAVTATSRRRVRHLITTRAGKVLQSSESETWRENLFYALKCTLDKPLWKCTSDGSRVPVTDLQFRIELNNLLFGAYIKNAPPTAQLHDLERTLDHDCAVPGWHDD